MYNMKRLTTTLLLALALVTAWAQNPFASLLSDFQLVANEHIQNRDQIDSLYYLKTRTYVAPYSGKKAIKKVHKALLQIAHIYEQQLPAHTSGYYNSQSFGESNSDHLHTFLSVYFSASHPSLEIGKKEHNYAVLRKNAPNPIYRFISGVEWWLDTADCVHFKLIDVFGPQSDYQYQKALYLLGQAKGLSTDSLLLETTMAKAADLLSKWEINSTERTVQSIHILCNKYRGDDPVIDEAIVEMVTELFLNYLNSDQRTTEGMVSVLRELTLPGFYAEIISNEESPVQHLTLSDLANQWPHLNIFCISYEKKGSPACQKYGDKAKNFLLQVYLQ